MDAFEPTREAAARLRDDLGLDAKTPSKIVIETVLKRLDITLTLLQAGNVVLAGARAVYDEQFRTICAEDLGDEGKQAVLIAHEIGHSQLHYATARCCDEDVDASGATERAQVGLQRVDSYGVRERRELHANVFAREFLLPRGNARHLHLSESMTATSISETVCLPKDLVRQQLLDGLLLPGLPPKVESAPSGPQLADPTQETAATHRDCAFLLQAGPGTGKTRTLVKRVKSLIEEGRDPASFLVLTFSNRAAGELFERLSAAAPTEASKIWIGTFHAFGLELVRRYHDRLNLSSDPPLFDRSDAIEVLQDILPTLPLNHYRNLWDPVLVLRDIIGAISRAKDELVDAVEYRRLAQAMSLAARGDDSKLAAEKCLEIAEVYDRYQIALTERQAVDFGDLIMRPTLLLNSDEGICQEVRTRHQQLMVDEYQDVNRASAGLLRALAGDGKCLWVVGDARQSIYRFRGASSDNMRLFSTDYPGAMTDKLGVNYRSTTEIVDVFSAFAPRMAASEGSLPLSLTAIRGSSGANAEIRVLDTLEQEERAIADDIRSLEASGIALRDQAVLCRTNRRLNEIAIALEARGIPVLHLGSFFEREEVRDLLSLMTLLADRSGSGLARLGASERYPFALQDLFVAARGLKEKETGTASEHLLEIASYPELSITARQSIEQLRTDLEGFNARTFPWEFLTTYLLDRTRLVAELANRNEIQARMKSIALWQLCNFLREPSPSARGAPMRRMLDQVRQLVLLAEERDLRQVPAAALHMNAVRLMTVHGSKGLEFEAVHIPGLTIAGFPANVRGARCPTVSGLRGPESDDNSLESRRAAPNEEEECLFFVAASRARTHLRVYRAAKQANGATRKPSPFLVGLPLVERPALQVGGAPRASTSTSLDVIWPDGHVFTADHIELFDKCPRRFFYTYAIGFAAARLPTPFSRTHDCLFEFIRWLVKERVNDTVSASDANHELERIWAERGPTQHAFALEYRQLAGRIADALLRRSAKDGYETHTLPVKLRAGTIMVEPSEVRRQPDGTVVVRRIRTGKCRSDEYSRLTYALYRLGAVVAFGSKARLEALHLTGDVAEPIEMTDKIFESRSALANSILEQISRGFYPASPDAVSCPRCPHFFICAAVPTGRLELPGADSVEGAEILLPG